jgi:hypothetical protein
VYCSVSYGRYASSQLLIGVRPPQPAVFACLLSLNITSIYTSAPFPTGRRTVYCLDTFNGFTKEDTTFEVKHRGKAPRNLGGFRSNSSKWLEYTFRRNHCKRTLCVKAEVENYEFRRPIAFCLIDVALYRPTVTALHKVWNCLSPGGLAVVSNCKPGNCFDGAMQAYDEFTAKHAIQPASSTTAWAYSKNNRNPPKHFCSNHRQQPQPALGLSGSLPLCHAPILSTQTSNPHRVTGTVRAAGTISSPSLQNFSPQ